MHWFPPFRTMTRVVGCLVVVTTGIHLNRSSTLASAFVIPHQPHRTTATAIVLGAVAQSKQEQVENLRSMSVRQLKQELSSLELPTNDVFEKEELVQRLLGARKNSSNSNNNNNTSSRNKRSSNNPAAKDQKILQVPLFLTYMNPNTRVAATGGGDGDGIHVQPSDQPYATIQIKLPHSDRPLSLLLDTACSGIVLRPELLSIYPQLSKLDTPITMTGAGGTSRGNQGLTQLQSFQLVGGKMENDNKTQPPSFGPLPAAIQDIGALPASLDGIMGLSFLTKFAAMEMDFEQEQLRLFPKVGSSQSSTVVDNHGNTRTVLTQGRMSMLGSLGVYTVPVYLGSRGPVNLLVDTGAACTILSWKGVEDLGLSRESPAVQPLTMRTGAMGSDNIAMELTHRLYVSSQLQLGGRIPTQQQQQGKPPGLDLSGDARLSIDVGRIAILESLASQGVGGILGVDCLMRCAAARFEFSGAVPTVTLFGNAAALQQEMDDAME